MSPAPAAAIYQDENVLAVSKPAGVAVIPGRGLAEEPLKAVLERSLGARLYVAHRLDRDASGLVVFAKNAASHRSLCLQFEGRRVRKKYLALVLGRVDASRGEVDRPIRAFGSGRMGTGPGGKPSRTLYRVLERFADASLLEVEPSGGRRHQIRVHLCGIGHPIVGDPLYGGPRPVGGASRLMLHALELGFRLPDGRPIVLRADPPPDFQAVLEIYKMRK